MYIVIAPIEARLSPLGISVLFSVDYRRPNGKTSRLFLSINDEYDIDDAMRWAVSKLRAKAIDYQPSLFITWDWEQSLVDWIAEYNLTRRAN